MPDCTHCKHAQWDYDDAYGGTVWFVEGCDREEQGCVFKDYEEE